MRIPSKIEGKMKIFPRKTKAKRINYQQICTSRNVIEYSSGMRKLIPDRNKGHEKRKNVDKYVRHFSSL